MPSKALPLDVPALTDEELRDICLRMRNPDVNDLLNSFTRIRLPCNCHRKTP